MKKLYSFLLILLISYELFAEEHGSTVHYPVGELGERWQFPSDHLPIGFSIGSVHVALWNTLNTRYLYHIHTNHQGLKGSLITTANVPKNLYTNLTIREEMIVDNVLEWVRHSKVSRNLLVLQEVGTEVYKELKRRLPQKMELVTAFPDDLANGDVFIYDKEYFDYVSLSSGSYWVRPRNTYMTLTLYEKETGRLFRFFQSHVPGGPLTSALARSEWAEEILLNFDPNAVNIIIGDMNRSPDFFQRDLQEAAEEMGMDRVPFNNLWVPYPTHIDTYKRATWIDNIFIYIPDGGGPVIAEKEPQNFSRSLEATCSLLRELRPCPLEAAFELWSQLTTHQFAVFQGGYGSWTAQQLQLALDGRKHVVFNVYQQFRETCGLEEAEKPNLTAKMQRDWMKENKEGLLEKWSHEDLIVIDQFDLLLSSSHGEDQLETVLEVLEIARRLREQEKSVVLVMHQASQASQKIWKDLEDKFSSYRSNLVLQGFLSDYEEEALLAYTQLSREEKDMFKSWTCGAPFAYASLVPLIGKEEGGEEIGFQQLCIEAKQHLQQAWSEIVLYESLDVRELLVDIASDDVVIDDLADSSRLGYLLETGLVGSKDGKWMMPKVARDFLIDAVCD